MDTKKNENNVWSELDFRNLYDSEKRQTLASAKLAALKAEKELENFIKNPRLTPKGNRVYGTI
jgi:hypothetical protein